ncbi:universal stress protein UspA [Microbacterium sp. Root61]|uniref:universal stress protein n=1 Tax=Microbacterium sp. Root61 TaxID=1736570 RepID=UPI0006F23BF8|nr:universal stress protein [Microbacterium sp. Root61]KRA24324.1 universal stress protein UspA [Microbacterium sp. Root61]
MGTRIVVGVVDSLAGRRAVTWAAERAAARGASLLLMAVVGGAVGAVGEGTVADSAVTAAGELLETHASALRQSGLDVEVVVRRGDPVRQLISATADQSLLVIGSDYRGRGDGPARGVHGVRIVAGASCPVVVVPDVDTADRRGVVVGVDGSPVSEAAIAFAAAEADRLGEPLIAVAVWTPLAAPRNPGVFPEDYLTNMQALTEENLALSLAGLRQDFPDLEIRSRAARGYPSQVINELAASARLCVVGSHGRGPITRFLLGSISHEVVLGLATVTAIVR